jgi:hypothetical protein
MDHWQIAFGIVSSISVLFGIYFKFRAKKPKDTKKSEDNGKAITLNGNVVAHQTIQQADTIIIHNTLRHDESGKDQTKIVDSTSPDNELGKTQAAIAKDTSPHAESGNNLPTAINSTSSHASFVKGQTKHVIDMKSDEDIRNYVEREIANLSLVDADFNSLMQKFVDSAVLWDIVLHSIKKIDAEHYQVHFKSSAMYSRSERFIVSPKDFPVINFAKKGDKYRIEAQIKSLDSCDVVLDRVTLLEKLSA